MNFPYVATFQQHMHMEYISQLIRYSRAYGSYQDFLDRGLLLTRKLLNQGFLFVKLKSSLQKFYGTFSFGRCVVCSSSIYGFWLPLWYLQTLLVTCHQLTKCILDVFLSQMVQNLAASVESFQIDQFRLYCRDLGQKKHTQVIF